MDKSVEKGRGIGARALLQGGFGDVPQIWAIAAIFSKALNNMQKNSLRLRPA
jgi:hypothetical protein